MGGACRTGTELFGDTGVKPPSVGAQGSAGSLARRAQSHGPLACLPDTPPLLICSGQSPAHRARPPSSLLGSSQVSASPHLPAENTYAPHPRWSSLSTDSYL